MLSLKIIKIRMRIIQQKTVFEFAKFIVHPNSLIFFGGNNLESS